MSTYNASHKLFVSLYTFNKQLSPPTGSSNLWYHAIKFVMIALNFFMLPRVRHKRLCYLWLAQILYLLNISCKLKPNAFILHRSWLQVAVTVHRVQLVQRAVEWWNCFARSSKSSKHVTPGYYTHLKLRAYSKTFVEVLNNAIALT
jgi:hypothetical protein